MVAESSAAPAARRKRAAVPEPEVPAAPTPQGGLLETKKEAPADADVKPDDAETVQQPDAPAAKDEDGEAKMQGKDVKVAEDQEGEGEDAPEEFEEADEDTLLVQPKETRREVPETATFRPEAVHVYGLDLLKQEHMDQIFKQFGYRYIEWMDDSTANIVFKDAAGAQQTLESLSFDKANDPPWRRTPDIVVAEDQPPIFLQLRLAMPQDKKRPKTGHMKVDDHFSPAYRTSKGKGKGKGKGKRKATSSSESTAGQKRKADEANLDEAGEGELDKVAKGASAQTGKKQRIISPEELARREKRAARFSALLPGQPLPSLEPVVEETEKQGEEPDPEQANDAAGEENGKPALASSEEHAEAEAEAEAEGEGAEAEEQAVEGADAPAEEAAEPQTEAAV